MPPDGRLGRGFERAVSGIDVDVPESFLAVSRIARRKRVARKTLFVAAVVVVLAGAAVGGFVTRSYLGAHHKTPAIAPAPHASTTPVGLGHEA